MHLALRSVALLVHLAYGLLLVLAVALPGGERLGRERLTGSWNRGLLRVLGLRVRVDGPPPPAGALIVANHISWLDISVMVAHAPTRFVSKSEVRHWPVAGWLANAAGSFYIERGRGNVRPLVDALVPFLRNGGRVTVFPEGTSTDGRSVRRFHSRLFCAAVEAGTVVVPAALSYGRAADGRDIAPFIGDDALQTHLLRLLARRGPLDVRLQWLAPLPARNADRDRLAETAQAAVVAARVHVQPSDDLAALPA